MTLLGVAVSVLPALVFLLGLVLLDSYKLVRIAAVLRALAAGAGAALLAWPLARLAISALGVDAALYSRTCAPLLEEALKAIYPLALLAAARIGFGADGAILGAAVGAGFAAIENITYLAALPGGSIGMWLVRGFGTAIMHAGTTAIVTVTARAYSDRWRSVTLAGLLGLTVAVLVHASFNQFVISPLLETLVILAAMPPLVILVYAQSERTVRSWLQAGFASDLELLTTIRSGATLASRVGAYLRSLQNVVPGETLADMLCYLQVHVELSIKAKGTLLMREAGFDPPEDPELPARFRELRFLERSIGPTGRLALGPFLHTSSRDLWQITMLERS